LVKENPRTEAEKINGSSKTTQEDKEILFVIFKLKGSEIMFHIHVRHYTV
jgi:hypothetical protein